MKILKHACIIIIVLVTWLNNVCAQKKWTVDDVPNPKEQPSWNYVSDPDAILKQETKSEINSILKRLEQETTDQVAVVILQSIGKKDPRNFATSLLRKWGVGQKEKNNGFLILLVMNQRRMEFEVGYGLEGKLTDLVCKQIQEEYMVPYAKQGNFNKAVLNGVQQVYFILSGKSLEVVPDNGAKPDPEPDYSDDIMRAVPSPSAEPVTYSKVNPRGWSVEKLIDSVDKRTGFGGIVFIISLFFYFLVRLKQVLKQGDAENFYNVAISRGFKILQFIFCDILFISLFFFSGIVINIFTGIVFIYLLLIAVIASSAFWVLHKLQRKAKEVRVDQAYHYARQLNQRWVGMKYSMFPFPIKYYRGYLDNYLQKLRKEGVSNESYEKMNLLNEQKDDQYLQKFQKLEEDISSVDYDVWVGEESNDVSIHGVVLPSKYEKCPKCKTHAFYDQSRRTIQSPTYSSSGKGLLTRVCKFCKYSERHEYVIAKLQDSSSSSSSGSSSSSSSSSGSSYGGGSSGGGGAGSSW